MKAKTIFGIVMIHLLVNSANGQSIRGEDLPLYYDVRTGNVTIDLTNVSGGTSIAYRFATINGQLRPENHTPFTGSSFGSATSREIGETNFAGFPGDVYSVGNIFPDGLTIEELEFTTFFGVDRWGGSGSPDDGPNYYALGELGSGVYHLFTPVFSPPPYPPVNDPSVGPPEIVRWAEDASLRYNALTGGLLLATTGENGGTIWSYEIILTQDEFLTDSFESIGDFGGHVTPNEIIEVSFEGIAEGNHFLGNILPPGLSQSELSGLVGRARFLGEPGHGADALDIDVNGIEMSLGYIVPEPTAMKLVLIALMMLSVRHRHLNS